MYHYFGVIFHFLHSSCHHEELTSFVKDNQSNTVKKSKNEDEYMKVKISYSSTPISEEEFKKYTRDWVEMILKKYGDKII